MAADGPFLAEAAGAGCTRRARRAGRSAPELMTEGPQGQFVPFESGYDPADPVDRAIMATRNAVFPLHGLMPDC